MKKKIKNLTVQELWKICFKRMNCENCPLDKFCVVTWFGDEEEAEKEVEVEE
jgi:hypothetical protein